MGRVRVASASDLGLDSVKRVEVAGVEICLAHTEAGEWLAINDVCSHEDFSLSMGEIWGDDVECPQHGSRFNLRSGKPDTPPAVVPVATYPVSVVGDDVYVEL